MKDANYANVLCFSFTEQLTKDSAKIKAHIRMVLEVSLFLTDTVTDTCNMNIYIFF